MATPFPGTVWTITDDSGNPISGAKIYTYSAGTLTAKAAYTTSALSVATSNPIITNPDGTARFYLGSGAYRVRVFDANDVELTKYADDNMTSGAELTTDLASSADASDGDALIAVKSELSGGVARTQHEKNADTVNALDLGITFDGVTNDTAAWVAAIGTVSTAGGGTIVCPPGTSLVTNVAFAFPSSVGIKIVGAGPRATYIKRHSGSAALMEFSANLSLYDTFLEVSDLTIDGIASGNNNTGLKITTIANVTTRSLHIWNCLIGVNSLGCLISNHYSPGWSGNATGFKCRKSGSIYANLVNFYAGRVYGNTSYGMDVDECSNLALYGTDIEGNGTGASGGALVTGANMAAETGFSILTLDSAWAEACGGWSIDIGDCSGLMVTMRGVKVAAPHSNQSYRIGAILSLTMIDCEAASGGNLLQIGATACSTLIGGFYHTITDTSTKQIRLNVTGNAPSDGLTSTAAVLGSTKTTNGVTASTATATPVTIFAAGGAAKVYLVMAYIANAGAIYTANARVMWDGTSARIVAENGSNMTLTLSGANVQATQTSGSNQVISWFSQVIG
jgi:hypothetical protein